MTRLRLVPPLALQPESQSAQFKGLMALFAGIERARVDLSCALSMHNPQTKNRNIEKAQEALDTALRDFKRSNAL